MAHLGQAIGQTKAQEVLIVLVMEMIQLQS